jgi:DNA invertase Pin-like site-specific DNA recombinase
MQKAKRCGLYVRVSTDLQQTDMQESELRAYAESRGWAIYKIYADKGFSGAKPSRPALDEMWADCRKRRIDVVAVWALDRLSRSLKELIGALEQFRQLGIDFVCLKQDLDTSTSAGRLLFHVIASVCEFERDLVRDRTVAGMAEARRRGKHIGRPSLRKFNDGEEREIAASRQNNGTSIRQLAIRFGTTQWMVQRILAKRAAGNQNRPVSG